MVHLSIEPILLDLEGGSYAGPILLSRLAELVSRRRGCTGGSGGRGSGGKEGRPGSERGRHGDLRSTKWCKDAGEIRFTPVHPVSKSSIKLVHPPVW